MSNSPFVFTVDADQADDIPVDGSYQAEVNRQEREAAIADHRQTEINDQADADVSEALAKHEQRIREADATHARIAAEAVDATGGNASVKELKPVLTNPADPDSPTERKWFSDGVQVDPPNQQAIDDADRAERVEAGQERKTINTRLLFRWQVIRELTTPAHKDNQQHMSARDGFYDKPVYDATTTFANTVFHQLGEAIRRLHPSGEGVTLQDRVDDLQTLYKQIIERAAETTPGQWCKRCGEEFPHDCHCATPAPRQG